MFSSSRPKNKIILIIAVESSAVRTTLVHIQDKILPRIIHTHYQNIPYRPHGGTSRLIKITLKAIRDLIEDATRYLHDHSRINNTPRSITEVHYVLSSPWIVSKARTIAEIFPRPTIVTRNKVMESIARERTTDIDKNPADIEIIEEKIFDVRLNGYSVLELEGRSAERFTISFAVSMAGTGMIERFREVCSHITHARSVYFHSSLLLQQIGIQSILPAYDNYMLVHIHGELTDTAIVNQHACVFFGTCQRGVDTMIRSIMHTLKSTPHMTDSLLTLYTGDHIDAGIKKNTEQVLNDVASGWNSDLVKSISEYTAPIQMAIVSADQHEDFFKESLARARPDIHAENLTLDELGVHVTYAPEAEKSRLAGLYTVAIHNMHT